MSDIAAKIFSKMGYYKGRGIGKNPKGEVAPVDLVPKAKPMLGGKTLPQKRKILGKTIVITAGPHKGLIGSVISETDSHVILENDIKVSIDFVSTEIPEVTKDLKKTKNLRWVYPGLIVRIVNKQIEEGTLYNTKVKILDVISQTKFTVINNQGNIIDTLSEKDVETTIPKRLGSDIMILKDRQTQRGKFLQYIRKERKVKVECNGDV